MNNDKYQTIFTSYKNNNNTIQPNLTLNMEVTLTTEVAEVYYSEFSPLTSVIENAHYPWHMTMARILVHPYRHNERSKHDVKRTVICRTAHPHRRKRYYVRLLIHSRTIAKQLQKLRNFNYHTTPIR